MSTLLHTVGTALAFVQNDEAVHYVLGEILGIGLPYAVQRLDRTWLLSPAQRDRAWNTASWGSALYGFGQLSLIAWFWVTRADARRWWRESPPVAVVKIAAVLLVGVLAAVLVTVVMWLLAEGSAMALDRLVPALLDAPGGGRP
jgi:hypothetical protein